MKIRAAVIGDIPPLRQLAGELDELHRRHHPELFRPDVDRDQRWFEQVFANPRAALFVAELSTEGAATTVGFLRVVDVQTPDSGVLLSRRFGLVEDLLVSSRHRQAGVATALLGAAEAWARGRGLPALEVTVWAFNREAQEFYARRDFSTLRHYLRKPLGS